VVELRRGERVRQGQVLGKLGNSGNSSGPHLHFQLMNHPSLLDADGLPFVLDRFKLRGRVPSLDALLDADASAPPVAPVPIDRSLRGSFRQRGLTDLDVVTLPQGWATRGAASGQPDRGRWLDPSSDRPASSDRLAARGRGWEHGSGARRDAMRSGATEQDGEPPAGGRRRRRATAGLAAWVAFLIALGLSLLAFMGGLVFGQTAVFTIGAVGLVALGLAVDLAMAASQVVEGDDPRQRRLRRLLAVGEVCTIVACFAASWWLSAGWDVYVSFPEQLLFGLLWIGSSAAAVTAFRGLRRHYGVSEPPAEPPPPEVPPEVADRFWADRRMRRRWWGLNLYGVLALIASIFAGVLIGGDDYTAAILITFGLLVALGVPWLILHRRWHVPMMRQLPPRRLPVAGEVPGVVSFHPRLTGVLILLVAPPLFALLALGIVSELRSGPEPAISRTGAAAIFVACGLALTGVVAAGVRALRMRMDVGPDGLRIVNFWKSHDIPWASAAAVEDAPSRLLNTLSIAVATTGQDVSPSLTHGICVRLKDGRGDPALAPLIRSTITVGVDPERSVRYAELVVALRREAEAHEVPAAL